MRAAAMALARTVVVAMAVSPLAAAPSAAAPSAAEVVAGQQVALAARAASTAGHDSLAGEAAMRAAA